MSDLNPYEEGLALELARVQERIKELEAEIADLKSKLARALVLIPCPYPEETYSYDEFHRELRAALAELKGTDK